MFKLSWWCTGSTGRPTIPTVIVSYLKSIRDIHYYFCHFKFLLYVICCLSAQCKNFLKCFSGLRFIFGRLGQWIHGVIRILIRDRSLIMTRGVVRKWALSSSSKASINHPLIQAYSIKIWLLIFIKISCHTWWNEGQVSPNFSTWKLSSLTLIHMAKLNMCIFRQPSLHAQIFKIPASKGLTFNHHYRRKRHFIPYICNHFAKCGHKGALLSVFSLSTTLSHIVRTKRRHTLFSWVVPAACAWTEFWLILKLPTLYKEMKY